MTATFALATIDDLLDLDLEAAAALDLASFAQSPLGPGQPDDHEVRHDEDLRVVRARSLGEELARPWSRLRAARDASGALLGYTLFWHVTDELHLLNVAVAVDARRRGIGRALMGDLLAYARAHAAARILLEVRASNAPALALYANFGFHRFNVRAGYYADGEDAVEMSAVV